jgi:cytochrome c oxidase subunit 3
MTDQFTLSEKDFQEEKRKKVAKPLLWFGMASIVMFFAGLTSAVIVRKGDGNWLIYDMPSMFLNSTIIIVVSSIVLMSSHYFAKRNNFLATKISLMLTLLLGIAFVIMQFEGYNQLVEAGIYLTGAQHNASGSFLYIISGVHLLHLLGGIIALIVVVFNGYKEQYNSKNLLGLQVCSTYWHFLGAMWVYLYLFFKTII